MLTHFDIVADLDTPITAYLKLCELKPRYLIESAEMGGGPGQFSFLGFGKALDLSLNDNGLIIGEERRDYPTDKNEYLDALRYALKEAPVLRPHVEGLHFAGGLVGVTGYDVVRLFGRLSGRTRPQPGIPQAAFCATSSLLIFDNLTRRVALLHDGTDSERTRLRKEVVRLLRGSISSNTNETPVSQAIPGMSENEYSARVRQCKEHIAAGDVDQVVISTLFKGSSNVSPFDVYSALRVLNPSPYMFYFEFGDLKVVGSSPETLVRLYGRDASMRPIAGTLPRGVTSEEDLRNEKDLLIDPKESAEHEMLIELARNDLAKVVSRSSLRIDPHRAIERYSHVMHMVSGVHGELAPEFDAFDLFSASLPAGTLVGTPKDRAMEIIEDIEDMGRGLYAGSAGYFSINGDMNQAITIRTIVFNGADYSFQVGGGIVADSVPENEYREVLAKSAVLFRALEIAEKGS